MHAHDTVLTTGVAIAAAREPDITHIVAVFAARGYPLGRLAVHRAWRTFSKEQRSCQWANPFVLDAPALFEQLRPYIPGLHPCNPSEPASCT